MQFRTPMCPWWQGPKPRALQLDRSTDVAESASCGRLARVCTIAFMDWEQGRWDSKPRPVAATVTRQRRLWTLR